MTKTINVFRFLRRNLKLTLINILGMATGLAASGIILAFVHQEYHFDASLRGSENIFRIIEKDGEPSSEGLLCLNCPNLPPVLRKRTPEFYCLSDFFTQFHIYHFSPYQEPQYHEGDFL